MKEVGKGCRIALVSTGGTIESISADGSLSPERGGLTRLLRHYREKAGDLPEIEIVSPYRILSEQLTGEYLDRLIAAVSEAIKTSPDGIVVTHGSDTLAYAGCALGYALGQCDVPVFLVASNRPIGEAGANGIDNFAAAVASIAEKRHRGVLIPYRNTGEGKVTLHRATRVLAHRAYDDDLFSVGFCPYGFRQEKTGFSFYPDYREDCDRQGAPTTGYADGKKVLWLHAHPDCMYPTVDDDVDAVMITAYHSGTTATEGAAITKFAASLKEKRIPLWLAGASADVRYRSARDWADLGIAVLPKASPVAMYMKLRAGLNPMLSRGGDLLHASEKSVRSR